MLLVSTIVFSLGSAIYLPTGTAILSESIPVYWTGTAMGIYGLMEDVGWMIGPAIGGVLWESISQPAAFFFASFIALMGIPLVLLLWRRKTSSMSVASSSNLDNKAELKPE
jgi:MFS family permease